MAAMLTRFIIQFISLYRITLHAKLISTGQIKVYHLPAPVIPFSFGNRVYIHCNNHSDSEINEIIAHEEAHIRQGHLVDILFVQFILIFQWFNPFAWLLNKAIRQILEFLADDSVISGGTDKKHYQYHLLKVTGNCVSPLINPFNFSSLKKRIVMMNKNKTSQINLLRLLLLLPITAIIILAFQPALNKRKGIAKDEKIITTTGLIVDAETLEPLASAKITIQDLKIAVSTDDKGFYKVQIPYEKLPLNYTMVVIKDGYELFKIFGGYEENKNSVHTNSIGDVEFIGINKKDKKGSFIHAMDGANENVASFGYDSVLARFEDFKLSNQRQRKLEQLKMGNEKVFFIIDGHSYVTAQNTQAASISSETDIVQVNDKPMPAEEVNRSIQRKNVTVVGSKKGILYLYVQTKTGDSTAP
jgi:hypothetical protein